MIKRIFSSIIPQKESDRRAELIRRLMRREATIGGQLFGPLSNNRRREFFCLDAHTWVWHEEWTDEQNNNHAVMTRYDVRPNGILKSQNGGHYQRVNQEEAHRLKQAAHLYLERIKNEVYSYV